MKTTDSKATNCIITLGDILEKAIGMKIRSVVAGGVGERIRLQRGTQEFVEAWKFYICSLGDGYMIVYQNSQSRTLKRVNFAVYKL